MSREEFLSKATTCPKCGIFMTCDDEDADYKKRKLPKKAKKVYVDDWAATHCSASCCISGYDERGAFFWDVGDVSTCMVDNRTGEISHCGGSYKCYNCGYTVFVC